MPRLSEVWSTVQSASTLCFNWEKCREHLRRRLYQPAKQFSYSLTSAWKWGQEVKPTSQGEVLQQAYSYWVHHRRSAMPSLSTSRAQVFAICCRQLLSLEIPAKLGKNVMTFVVFIRCFLLPDIVLGSKNFDPKEAELARQILQGSVCPQLKAIICFHSARAFGTLKIF